MYTSTATTGSRGKLLLKTLIIFPSAFVFIGLLLFLPAGTLNYTDGWIYIAALLVPMTFFLIYMLVKDPELLQKRINIRERQSEQKKYVKVSILLFVSAFIVPGLDFRFGWSHVPGFVKILSLVFMLFGYAGFVAVILQNRYASRVIEIQEHQRVIDTGLYSIVRHPMYLFAIVLYMSSPLVLGSWYALIPMAFIPFLLAFRLLHEEEFLKKELPGYTEYMRKTRYRLIPFVW